jgi:hypothetical protein
MEPPAKTVSVTVDLTPGEALALAQFVKRSLFDTYRQFAVDEEEALSCLPPWRTSERDLPPKVSAPDEIREHFCQSQQK